MSASHHSEEIFVLRQDEAGVATLTLNRPKQYNALSQAMLGALQAALDAVAADETIRVVVIAGSGRGVLRRPRPQGNARPQRPGVSTARCSPNADR
jgi:1,4-dihydroxy-2-naphthoyl-CoA synthase